MMDLPETSKPRQWSNDNLDTSLVGACKCLDTDLANFLDIFEEFPHRFYSLKRLGESLDQIIFPLKDGVIWTGTDGSI
ncbi:hypothetical protein F4818DRAFT_55168 [Hypoxylon cercidicola]|nr:hypothetical protein F4818DRAFT_55168 [Hypoxylon cercidicola]